MKLVRDKIESHKWDDDSKKAFLTTIPPEFLRPLLREKLYEEIAEMIVALGQQDFPQAIREAADVQEVLIKLLSLDGITPETVEVARQAKLEYSGGFDTLLGYTGPTP